MAHLSGRSVRTDRRHDRRSLEAEEIRRLLDAARNGPSRSGIPGPERAVLYQVAVETGLRVGELRSLTWGNVDLEGEQPTITVKAAYSKRRRDDVQPLAPSTVETVRGWRESLPDHRPADSVFPNLKTWTRTGDIINEDLEAARENWLADAPTPCKRAECEQLDFLQHEDADGRVADFHALRHTYITNLVRGGVQPKVAQQLARHSTITLTMDRYTHVILQEKADALRVLPEVSTPESPSKAEPSSASP